MKFENGRVYKNGLRTFVLVYVEDDKWMRLSIERSVIKGLSCPMIHFGANCQFIFTEEELIKNHNADNWKKLDGRLRIEKIDYEITFVEYSIGGNLEVINEGEQE